MSERVREPRLTLEEIPSLSDNDLLVWAAKLKTRVNEVQCQIENWNYGSGPARLDNDDWRRRAGSALGITRTLLTRIKQEQTQRRVAQENAPPGSKADAFVRAAKLSLDKDTLSTIWQLAVEMHPNVFGPPA